MSNQPGSTNNVIDNINQMLEYSKVYLASYFNDLKAKVDRNFSGKLKHKDHDFKLKEEINKKWAQIIATLEKCEAKCLQNKLPDNVRKEINSKMHSILHTNHENAYARRELLNVKHKLESYFLANDSYLALSLMEKQPKISDEKLLIVEEGFNQTEIESLLRNPIHFTRENFNHPKINITKMEYVLDMKFKLKCDSLIYLEEFSNETNLQISKDYCSTIDLSYFNDLKAIKTLTFSNCIVLKKDIFKNLINLDTLNLSMSYRLWLDFGCFNGLSNLTSLNLSLCNIKVLEKNILSELVNLNELELAGNFGICLRDGCFNGVTLLQYLNLAWCKIKSLEKTLFLEMNYLKTINLKWNDGLNLEEDFFNGMHCIKNILV